MPDVTAGSLSIAFGNFQLAYVIVDKAGIRFLRDPFTDTAVDRASGVEVCHTMLVRRTGEAWALPAADKKDAEINASAIRDFLAGQT